MEFLSKIKRKILMYNVIQLIFFAVTSSLFIFLYIGFKTSSYNKDAACCLIFVIVGLAGLVLSIYQLLTDNRYNEMLCDIETIGNVEEIGEMLGNMCSCPTVRGDLRCNEKILFYMKGPSVNVVRPDSVVKIETRVSRGSRGGYFYGVEVQTKARRIFIETHWEDQMEPLCDDIIEIFAPHLAYTRNK